MATINGNNNSNTLVGTGNDDTINARGGADTVLAGNGDDLVLGGNGNDTLSGQKGDDTLLGEGGNDNLNGGDGDDGVNGGGNADLVQGGAGNDSLTGGPGADSFIINLDDEQDTIIDFGNGNDTISINGFSQIKSFNDLDIKLEGNNTILDLGLVENGVEGVQVLTILDNQALTAADFDFPAGKVVVAFKVTADPVPVIPLKKVAPPPTDDDGRGGREDTAMDVMGVQDHGFNDGIGVIRNQV